jgi:asparagine synthase (glutamine-hydrolysing)
LKPDVLPDMSSIFGILRLDGGTVAARDLERLSDALAHRGPDGRKFVADGPIGLGHALMRVNREDQFDAQPLRDREAGLTLVADLRLDNRDELAAALDIDAAALRDMPDSALVMRAYQKWGEDCAGHLLGDFAFAIWDARANKLVLGRDHMGQRAILFHRNAERFVLASDAKALRAFPDVPQGLTDVQIARMLMHDLGPRQDARVAIDGVSGATVMTIGLDGAVATRRYWEPHADPAHEGRDEAYYVAAYRRVLGEAVACRLRRVIGAPGLIFSGGYDSAAIAGLAGPVLAGRRLVAASSVMPADYRGSIRHARRWVEMCARDMPWLDVHYVTREGKSILTGLEQAFLSNGGPAGPYHFVMQDLLATLVRGGARLIMDGHGGDYTLHPRGQAALARFLATFQFRRFLTELRAHRRMTGASYWEAIKRHVIWTLLPGKVTAHWRRMRQGRAPAWGDQPVAPALAERLIAERKVDPGHLRIAARAEIDMRGQMLAVIERQMAGVAPGIAAEAARHGLELTRPFHDKRVVELALAIPQELYVKNGRNRYLACVALADVYPREFQTRWRRNDDEIPDFQRMAKSIEPQLLADIARMEKSDKLASLIDFAKIRRLLAARGIDDHNSGWEQETQLALHGYLVARYVEWFRRDNR